MRAEAGNSAVSLELPGDAKSMKLALLKLKIIKQTSFLVGIGMFLVIFLPGYAKIQQLRQKNKELEIEMKKLSRENLVLHSEKDKLEKDPAYLEQVGREELGIVRKGEIIYRLVPEEEKKK